MVQVKALRAHENGFGDKFRKEKGDSYDHPDPRALVDNKLVEIVDGGKDGEGRGAAGTGAGTAKSPEGDGAEHAKPGSDKKG